MGGGIVEGVGWGWGEGGGRIHKLNTHPCI